MIIVYTCNRKVVLIIYNRFTFVNTDNMLFQRVFKIN